jgi:hypothetical protein
MEKIPAYYDPEDWEDFEAAARRPVIPLDWATCSAGYCKVW